MQTDQQARPEQDRPRPVVATLEAMPIWARLVPGMAATYGLGMAAFGLVFIGGVLTSGCFMSCSDPQPWFGIPLLVLSGISAVGSLWLLVWTASPTIARRARRASMVRLGTSGGLAIGGLAMADTVGWIATVAVLAAVWMVRRT